MLLRAPKLTLPAALISGAFLLGAGLAGCGKNETGASLLADAKAYQQKGDNKAALIQLKNAVVKSPDDATIRFELASLYTTMGDPVSAEKEIRKAISLGTPAAQALPVLAKALAAQGETKKLLAETEAAAKTPELLVLRGHAFLQTDDEAHAKESFEAALKLKPSDGNALIGLASHALVRKDLDAARSYTEEAVAKDPKNAEVWMFKGNMATRDGKADEALAAFSQALAIEPEHRSANLEKAYVEIGAGKFDAARADLEAARKRAPGSVIVTYTQALLDHTEGKNAQALEAIQKVLKVAPEHMPSILLAGAIQLSLGSYEQAEQNLKKYLEKYPDTLYARKLLATTLLRSKQPADAAAALAPALADSQDPQLLALAGESYLQVRDFDKASNYFQKASDLAPKTAALHTSLGLSKLGQGDNAKGISELELAASMDPKSQQAGLALVRTQLGLKQYDKALATVATLEKAQPDNAMLQNLKGGVYMSKGDLASARASLNRALQLQPTYFAAVANLAQLDLKEKKPQDAKQRFLAFLEKDKKHIGAMMALADLANLEGKNAEATSWYERASNENPEAEAPAMQLISQYLRVGEKQKALTAARKLSTANPANPDLLELLGQAQLANKDEAAALESYSKIVTLLPKSPTAHLRLGGVQALMKNDSAAMESVKRALSLDPENVQGQLALVDLSMRKGDPSGALALVKKLQKQTPDAPAPFLLEGDIQMLLKKPDLALRAYDQAFTVGKNAQLLIKSLQAMKALGKDKEADARALQYAAAHPDDAVINLYVGESYLNSKQYKLAIARFESVLKKFPDSVLALNNLAWAYQQEKDARALATAEKAVKLAPQNAPVLDTLGWILVEQGNTQRAVTLLQQAVAADPQAGDIRFHLASALFKAGDKEKARKEVDAALAGKPFASLEEARALRKQL
ncbi:MAG: XrtA/PEP-CTERM system TPR-repeat protein PrsT [Gammaproteobacteria bacterium]